MFWKEKKVLELSNCKEEEITDRSWDCEKDKHRYIIVDYPARINEENGKPRSPCFLLECNCCRKKKISTGNFWNYLPMLWETDEISFDEYVRLKKEVKKELEREVREWEEKQPKKLIKKKPKRDNYVNKS